MGERITRRERSAIPCLVLRACDSIAFPSSLGNGCCFQKPFPLIVAAILSVTNAFLSCSFVVDPVRAVDSFHFCPFWPE
jgi:hypothetical protein